MTENAPDTHDGTEPANPPDTAAPRCDGYEWRGDIPRKCQLPLGHKAPDGTFLGRSCEGTDLERFDRDTPDDPYGTLEWA